MDPLVANLSELSDIRERDILETIEPGAYTGARGPGAYTGARGTRNIHRGTRGIHRGQGDQGDAQGPGGPGAYTGAREPGAYTGARGTKGIHRG